MEIGSDSSDSKKCSSLRRKQWLKLFVYVLMIFLTGCTYWGWSGIQELLYKAGSFEELCEGDLETTTIEIGGKHYIDCGPRKSGINNLYTVAYSAHFITSVFTGFFVDYVGAKYCYAVGQVINLTMWILLGCMPKNGWVLLIAFFLIGLTAESLYMPLLAISYQFPNKRSFVISLMGSARSLSFIVPSLMSVVYQLDYFKPESLYIICAGYAVLGNLLCLIVGLLIVDKRFDGSENRLDSESCEGELRGDLVIISLDDNKEDECVLTRVKRRVLKGLKHPQFFEYLGVVLCASLFLTSIGFVNKSHREMLITSEKKNAAHIFKYFNMLTFIPAPALGKVIDLYGAGLVLLILHSCCFMYYFCASFDVFTLKVIACVFYFFAVSLCISSTYCYMNQRFPRRYFGILVGFSFLAAGLTNLTNIPLYNLGSKTWEHLAPYNFRRISYIIMGYMFVCILTSSWLYMFSRKKVVLPKEEEGVTII